MDTRSILLGTAEGAVLGATVGLAGAAVLGHNPIIPIAVNAVAKGVDSGVGNGILSLSTFGLMRGSKEYLQKYIEYADWIKQNMGASGIAISYIGTQIVEAGITAGLFMAMGSSDISIKSTMADSALGAMITAPLAIGMFYCADYYLRGALAAKEAQANENKMSKTLAK